MGRETSTSLPQDILNTRTRETSTTLTQRTQHQKGAVTPGKLLREHQEKEKHSRARLATAITRSRPVFGGSPRSRPSATMHFRAALDYVARLRSWGRKPLFTRQGETICPGVNVSIDQRGTRCELGLGAEAGRGDKDIT